MRKLRQRRAPGTILPLTSNGSNGNGEGFFGRSSPASRRKRKDTSVWGNFIGRIGCFCTVALSSTPILLIFVRFRQKHDNSDHGHGDGNNIFHMNMTGRLMMMQEKLRQNKNKSGMLTHNILPILKHEFVHCSDGSTGYLNDDYCDCTDDGKDEPLTSACSNILVQHKAISCKSSTEIGPDGEPADIFIYPSRIKDGIRDCLDGRDEDATSMDEFKLS